MQEYVELTCDAGHVSQVPMDATGNLHCHVCDRLLVPASNVRQPLQEGEVRGEDRVEVGGRSLPRRVWEAEVLVRSAACIILIQGIGLWCGGAVSCALRAFRGPWLEWAHLAWTLGGGVLTIAARGLLDRSPMARWLLVMASGFWMATGSGCGSGGLFLLGAPGYEWSSLNRIVPWFKTVMVFSPSAFVFFVLQMPSVECVFSESRAGQPLATLSSACPGVATARTYSARGMVLLALGVTATVIFLRALHQIQGR